MIKLKSDIAQEYYTAMKGKDLSGVEHYVDDNVMFSGPFAQISGKKEYLQVCQEFMDHIETLEIKNVFGSENRAVVVYDVYFPAPIGITPGVAVVDFDGDIIKSFNVFYDSARMEETAKEIFSAE